MHISYFELKKSVVDVNKLKNIVISLLDADFKFSNNENNEIIKDNANNISNISSVFVKKMPVSFAMYFVDNLHQFSMWKDIINDLIFDSNLAKLIFYRAVIKNNYEILEELDISDFSLVLKITNNNKMVDYLQNKQEKKEEKRNQYLEKRFNLLKKQNI